MAKIKKIWEKIFDVLDDILAYIMTILGILLSAYMPLLKSMEIIDIKADWWRLAMASLVAILIVSKQESLETDSEGSIEKSKEGRKKHFLMRMANALSQGIAWNQIIQLASN
jgi:hypothetical protein